MRGRCEGLDGVATDALAAGLDACYYCVKHTFPCSGHDFMIELKRRAIGCAQARAATGAAWALL